MPVRQLILGELYIIVYPLLLRLLNFGTSLMSRLMIELISCIFDFQSYDPDNGHSGISDHFPLNLNLLQFNFTS